MAGKITVSTHTRSSIEKNGIEPLYTSSMPTPGQDPFKAYRTIPTGGVIPAIPTVINTMTQNQIRSNPSATTAGPNRGTVIIISAVASIKQPITSRQKTMSVTAT